MRTQPTETYVVIVVPPKHIQTLVHDFRNHFKDTSEYKLPPHITLLPPFQLAPTHGKELIGVIRSIAAATSPMDALLTHTGVFENRPPVWFCGFSPSTTRSLRSLHKKLLKAIVALHSEHTLAYKTGPKHNVFNPHMTLIEKVPKANKKSIAALIEPLIHPFSFAVGSIELYKRQSDDKTYTRVQKFTLRG